jgi:dihydrofolate reductase
MVALVVAVADNYVIGREVQLPWGHLPADLRHFKQVTIGHPVVMGRKTYDSIGRALPGRANIVVTRQQNWSALGCEPVHSVLTAIDRARELAGPDGVICVIGGGEIYREALPQANVVYLTEVHGTFAGDVTFPVLSPSEWREVTRERHEADASNAYAYSFVTYQRL